MAYTEAFPILHTDDLAALVAFYAGTMGLPVTYRYPADGEPEFVTVAVGNCTVGLGTYASAQRLLGTLPRGGTPVQLCVYTDDLDRDLAALRAAGAPVLLEPVDQPWRERMCYVADPDGTPVMLAQRLDGRTAGPVPPRPGRR